MIKKIRTGKMHPETQKFKYMNKYKFLYDFDYPASSSHQMPSMFQFLALISLK